jgi:hypothetical protein
MRLMGLGEGEAFLAQGTLRPDLIESANESVSAHAEVIKTHHNDTPLVRHLRRANRIVEPLRLPQPSPANLTPPPPCEATTIRTRSALLAARWDYPPPSWRDSPSPAPVWQFESSARAHMRGGVIWKGRPPLAGT